MIADWIGEREEDNFNPTAVGDKNFIWPVPTSPLFGQISPSYGLAQINRCYHPDISIASSEEPVFAANWIAEEIVAGRDRQDWTTVKYCQKLFEIARFERGFFSHHFFCYHLFAGIKPSSLAATFGNRRPNVKVEQPARPGKEGHPFMSSIRRVNRGLLSLVSRRSPSLSFSSRSSSFLSQDFLSSTRYTPQ